MPPLTLDGTTGVSAVQTGAVESSDLPAGSVIQVVSATKTDVFSTSSAGYVDITGLSVSVTPISSSNKILIFASVNMSVSADDTAHRMRLVRDATPIFVGDAFSSTVQASGSDVRGQATTPNFVGVNHLDSPAATSAIVYKIQGFAKDAGVFYINRGRVEGTSDFYNRTASSITVMEIAG